MWTTPRLLRVDGNGRIIEIAHGNKNGPWTGVDFGEGAFYIAEGGVLEGGRILKVQPNGAITALVTNLPSFGDHHTDGPIIGPDGWLYFGQGTASNSGVIGEDSAKFGWLKRRPQFHDIPGQDITLVGENFSTSDALNTGNRMKVHTGAFLPFGTPSSANQTIKGSVICSGAIMRIRIQGGDPELFAWGFRNPFGLAFSADGRLFVSDNGYDDRGSRPIWGSPDVLWEVTRGKWYGWPDFSEGRPLTHTHFKPPSKPQPSFLLAEHPNNPPLPTARFPVHASADGMDFSRNPAFGHVGELFVALFGDEAPAVGKVLYPVGSKVVRVNISNGLIEEFTVNKGKKNGPASKIGGGGLEHPVSVRFTKSGDALYVVDFGVITHTKKGVQPRPGTGILWRITRTNGL